VLFIVDRGEIAREFQAHALALRHFDMLTLGGESLEKPRDRHAQYLGDFIEAACGNPVQPPFVFMRLLVRDPDHLRELLLRQAEHDPALANPVADIAIRRVGAGTRPGLLILLVMMSLLRLAFVGPALRAEL